jgi:hypothetical protein
MLPALFCCNPSSGTASSMKLLEKHNISKNRSLTTPNITFTMQTTKMQYQYSPRYSTEVGAQTSIIALKVSLSLHGFITNNKELPTLSVNNIGGNE